MIFRTFSNQARSVSGALLGAVIFLTVLFVSCSESNEVALAFDNLTETRETKKQELIDYFSHVEQTVVSVQEDAVLQDAFLGLNDLFRGEPTARAARMGTNLAEIEHTILERYLDDYQIFYDVHFVNAQGDVFYSILKQDDLFENIFQGELRDTALAQKLRESPDAATVDFQFPGFGGEPSAFFAQPVRDGDRDAGWIVFQFASSRLGEIFAYDSSLGQTGEVFLVNRDHFLLTDSYHSAESSVLRQHLSAENIEGKFRDGSGEKMVIDYRGYEALTSFEVCSVMDFEWLLIAKIDLDEVITRQYKQDPGSHHDRIRGFLRETPVSYSDATPPDGDYQNVRLDSFERVDPGGLLHTPGVATCTSIIVSLPGRFAYMAHVSPYDRIYGGTRTDLIRSLLRRIHDFEVADKDIRQVEVVIVTPQINYSERLVDEFVGAGIFLSQITFMKNPQARCANVHYDLSSNETWVTWCIGDDYEERHVQLGSRSPSLAEVMEELLPQLDPRGLTLR